MKPIRVLVSGLPRMLRDIVSGVLESQPDMQVVGAAAEKNELDRAILATSADVLVLGCEEAELAQTGNALLASHPFLEILAVGADGKRSFLYHLEPAAVSLGEVSPRLLMDSIRKTTHSRPWDRPKRPTGASHS